MRPPLALLSFLENIMKIRMLTTACGPKFNASAGEVVEVANKFGKELIDGYYAEPFEGLKMVDSKQALKNKAAAEKGSGELQQTKGNS